MSEIQELIRFLTKGKRKEISLSEYIRLQEQTNHWSQERLFRLLSELSRSNAIPPDYTTENGQVIRLLRIRDSKRPHQKQL